MTNPLKNITVVRGGDVTFFAMFIMKCEWYNSMALQSQFRITIIGSGWINVIASIIDLLTCLKIEICLSFFYFYF